MSEQFSSLEFQMDEKNNPDTARKWNIILEEMENKFETSYTVSNERLTKAGPMIWTVMRPLTITQNVRPKEDKKDTDTSNAH